MTPVDDRLADFLYEIGHLTKTPRSGFSLLGTSGQNVAEHSHRTAVVAYVLSRMAGTVDPFRVVLMALFHDAAETRTGDLHSLHKRYTQRDESAAHHDQVSGLPFARDFEELCREYESGTSDEAILARDADHLELLLTLREKQCRGEVRAADWLTTTRARLKSEVACRIADAVLTRDPRDWWNKSTNETEGPAGGS